MPTAVIIAGGEGTRLRPITLTMPKPLVPILGRPFLDYQLAQIKTAKIPRVVFSLHYMPDAIQKQYEEGVDWGMRFFYSIETEPMGTAGAVKMGEEHFGSDELVVFNGDVLSDIDVSGVIEFHRKHKARVTITLVHVKDPTAFGLVFTDDKGRVQRFLEKPKPEEATVDTINAGLYIINRDVMEDIPVATRFSFEKDLYPRLLERGDPVYAYIHKGYWLDIGTPGKYLKACSDLASGYAHSSLPVNEIMRRNIFGHPSVKIDSLANLTGPCFLDKDTSIGSDSRIGPNVFTGRNVHIGSKAKISNTIILHDTRIEDGVVISNSILCRNCNIASHVLLPNGTILGAYSRITEP